MRILVVLFFALVSFDLCPRVATATSSPSLPNTRCIDAADPDVWLARTGGFWRQGKHFGHFRVVVVRRGVEHAIDWAQLQVVESDDQSPNRRVTACIDLGTPGVKGYATDVTFSKASDKLTAVAVRIEMKGMGAVVLEDVFLVTNDGKVSRLVDAKAVDLGD